MVEVGRFFDDFDTIGVDMLSVASHSDGAGVVDIDVCPDGKVEVGVVDPPRSDDPDASSSSSSASELSPSSVDSVRFDRVLQIICVLAHSANFFEWIYSTLTIF